MAGDESPLRSQGAAPPSPPPPPPANPLIPRVDVQHVFMTLRHGATQAAARRAKAGSVSATRHCLTPS